METVDEHTRNSGLNQQEKPLPGTAVMCYSGLEIATDTVANATNIFSLATKNSSLVAKLATRFLYDLDLN